jgi:hypothetical protein
MVRSAQAPSKLSDENDLDGQRRRHVAGTAREPECVGARPDADLQERPPYSTVTVFARFRGLSTSRPRRVAMA